MNGALSVITAPMLDPGQGRIETTLPAGATVSELVLAVLPGLACTERVRVTLSLGDRVWAVPTPLWSHVRPRPGVRVLVRVVPGDDALRTILSIAITVAASAFAAPLAGFFGFKGALAEGLATIGLTLAGNLLLSALIPPPSEEKSRNVYTISSWRNDIRRGDPIPCAFGRHRYAPPFAATSWTEIDGDVQYVRALFCFGYGPLRISDLRLGDTSLNDYEDVDFELREGRAGDLPVTLYHRQVIEESHGVDLVRPFPRDAAGEVLDDEPAIETPVRRWTATGTSEIAVLIGFPSGLFNIDKKGRTQSVSVTLRIRARQDGAGAWEDIAELDVRAAKREAFVRVHRWTPPVRGRWQVEITRMTPETTSTQTSDRTVLTALQSIRPEYPIALDKPVALVALRIRATYQLNGTLDSFNALVEREMPLRSGVAWLPGYGRNPASAYLAALTGASNPYPVPTTEIDWDGVADWYNWCEGKGLKYDRIHDTSESLGEMLSAICAAGRATPHHDGRRWGVVIDRPQDVVIDHISPRNASDFTWSRAYFDPPDALRVRFLDETADHAPAERVVPWPGHTGPVGLTEALDLPGKTDPDEVWRETRRRMYELIHRPDRFSAIQDGASRIVTRGDLVMGSFDVLDHAQIAARVTSVRGQLVELDSELIRAPETEYGLRFRGPSDGEDIGASVLRRIASGPDVSRAVRLVGEGPLPNLGDAVHLGPLNTESRALRVRGIEPGEGFSGRVLMIDAAPEIDELTDAETPPTWDGRVGAPVSIPPVVPAAPLFVRIAGFLDTDAPGGVSVTVAPGPGSRATVSGYSLEHRLAGAPTWTAIAIPAAQAGVEIKAYVPGEAIELRCRAIGNDGTAGPWSAVLALVVGAGDPALPGALETASISISGGLGSAQIVAGLPSDAALSSIQIYRAAAGVTLDRDIHGVGAPISVQSGGTFALVDGDGTRTTLISDGEMAGTGDWDAGTGWTLAGGQATHAAGAAGELGQETALVAGRTYRLSWRILGRTAGDLTPRLIGATTSEGVSRVADGTFAERLIAPASPTELQFVASSDFDGSLDDVVLFEETAACVDAGAYDYWFEPLNDEGQAGPTTTAIRVVIR
ncbi:host specificity protein J [Oceaniglobus trochenteri]|uniref:host specificity protein J n=1 Tax=Oceaniglobus trochenteri TaxID=2763260 RepID=UPI001CFF7F60|nr:phage tail protein [Oceaniglobus trochenteri]